MRSGTRRRRPSIQRRASLGYGGRPLRSTQDRLRAVGSTKTDVDDQIHALVEKIPRGFVVSYAALGRAMANPVSARRVGLAMSRAPDGLPWHRVVRAGGRLAELPSLGGKKLQRILLENEGVTFSKTGKVSPDHILTILPSARDRSITKDQT